MDVVIVNFKTYPQASGDAAVELARQCEAAGHQYGFDVRVAVQATDLARVAHAVRIPVYAQHADPIEPGRHTGFLSPHAIRLAGARGALLNHSEHRLRPEDTIAAARLLEREGLDAVVLVEDVPLLRKLEPHLAPAFFGIEPPELVAGDVSVSMARPDLVKEAVQATRRPLLVGAGVKTHEDIVIARELRAAGIVLSSGIVLAPHRDAAFKKLFTQHGR
jgi:triosephosphate isomerase